MSYEHHVQQMKKLHNCHQQRYNSYGRSWYWITGSGMYKSYSLFELNNRRIFAANGAAFDQERIGKIISNLGETPHYHCHLKDSTISFLLIPLRL